MNICKECGHDAPKGKRFCSDDCVRDFKRALINVRHTDCNPVTLADYAGILNRTNLDSILKTETGA